MGMILVFLERQSWTDSIDRQWKYRPCYPSAPQTLLPPVHQRQRGPAFKTDRTVDSEKGGRTLNGIIPNNPGFKRENYAPILLNVLSSLTGQMGPKSFSVLRISQAL